MQHIFVNQSGKTFAPDFFTLYYKADGRTYIRIEHELNAGRFSEHADVVKIELYENKMQNSLPILRETIYKQENNGTVIPQYSINLSQAG